MVLLWVVLIVIGGYFAIFLPCLVPWGTVMNRIARYFRRDKRPRSPVPCGNHAGESSDEGNSGADDAGEGLLEEGASADSSSAGPEIVDDSLPASGDFVNSFRFTEDQVYTIELQLKKCERVSVGFLFFNDDDVSLKFCLKSSTRYGYRGLYKYVTSHPVQDWGLKLLECLYLVKNYFLLEKLGVDKFVAAEVFENNSNISPLRLTLYQICEEMVNDEANRLREAVSNIPNEFYLEIFFLRISDEWPTVLEVLKSFSNPKLVCLTEKLISLLPVRVEPSPSSISPPPNVASSVSEHDVYPIFNPENVGFCLIINQVHFVNYDERKGSEKDVKALQEVMSKLNFEVETINNVTWDFFGEPMITLISNKFAKDHSIFFFVVLSHGDKGTIICSDGKPISIEGGIYNILLSVPALHGIPKILIFQACQGMMYLRSLNNVETDDITKSDIETDLLSLKPYNRPDIGDYISDAIIVMSTVPGFKSFRDTKTGTYFIQFLCQCLEMHSDDHIFDIVTRLIRKVKEKIVSTKIESLKVTQQPVFSSLLTKRLYLKPLK